MLLASDIVIVRRSTVRSHNDNLASDIHYQALACNS